MSRRRLAAAACVLGAGCDPGYDSNRAVADTVAYDSSGDSARETGAPDTADSDGYSGPALAELDLRHLDGDGDGFSPQAGDCDDSRSHVHPGAADYCDGLDADCDGEPIPDGSCSEMGDPTVMWTWSWDGCEGGRCDGYGRLEDVDGDGRDDLSTFMGTDAAGGNVMGVLNSGSFHMWEPREPLPGATWSDNFPEWLVGRVESGGDVNGDGLGDVWVCTISDAGYTGGMFLMLGQEGGFGEVVRDIDDAADASWIDGGGAEYYGTLMTGKGEFNGDGLTDALVAVGNTSGAAYALILGEVGVTGEHRLREVPATAPEAAYGWMGRDDHIVADLDGDGIDEVAIETGRFQGDDGVMVFLEGEELTEGASLAEFAADAWFDAPGGVLIRWGGAWQDGPPGDIDGDGFNDIALSLTPEFDPALSSCVGVFSGTVPAGDLYWLPKVQVCAPPEEYLSLEGWLPDVDADGSNELSVLTDSGDVCAIPSTRLRGGGVEFVGELLGPCTDGLVPVTTHIDFDGDGRAEWIYNDSDWKNPDTNEVWGRTLIVAGFDIPWDDASKW